MNTRITWAKSELFSYFEPYAYQSPSMSLQPHFLHLPTLSTPTSCVLEGHHSQALGHELPLWHVLPAHGPLPFQLHSKAHAHITPLHTHAWDILYPRHQRTEGPFTQTITDSHWGTVPGTWGYDSNQSQKEKKSSPLQTSQCSQVDEKRNKTHKMSKDKCYGGKAKADGECQVATGSFKSVVRESAWEEVWAKT